MKKMKTCVLFYALTVLGVIPHSLLAATCTSEPVTITGSGNLLDGVVSFFSSFAAGFLLIFK